jgi:hypothetical protein
MQKFYRRHAKNLHELVLFQEKQKTRLPNTALFQIPNKILKNKMDETTLTLK